MSYQLIGNSMTGSEVGVILPTYGEAENIAKLIDDIENLKINASILVIDDSSPDGTAEIVKEKQNQYPNIMLYVRPKKTGLGTAITDGFKIFLSAEKTPKYVFTMDADYSHNPQDIPQLLATMKECDCGIVIGSRYVKGGKIAGWPFSQKNNQQNSQLHRQSISWFKTEGLHQRIPLLLHRIPQRSHQQPAQPHL